MPPVPSLDRSTYFANRFFGSWRAVRTSSESGRFGSGWADVPPADFRKWSIPEQPAQRGRRSDASRDTGRSVEQVEQTIRISPPMRVRSRGEIGRAHV